MSKKITLTHENGRSLGIRRGFSPLGFLIPQLWALVNAQWRFWALGLIPVQLVNLASMFQEYCDKSGLNSTQACNLPTDELAILAFGTQVALMGVCGFHGSSIVLKDALKQGYELHT